MQLSLFWVAAAFLAAGIFLAPIIAGREPRGQHRLSYGLLGALVVVVVGSLLGEFLGIRGVAVGEGAAGSAAAGSSTSTWRGSGRSC